ncbi:MAG: cytochrome c-type biogenesis protein CcmH [Proteobacteria bacterium]|nr:cytochrome c-type biogenesis protein CcmH [Pseudomonadota bacterium]
MGAWFLVSLAVAAPPQSFDNEAQELRFNALVEEIRCLVCQNQNLADSDAELAQDLRREVLDMMKAGQTDDQIKQFLVDRYGDFVLYRPRMNRSTYLLWLGPAGLLLLGAIAVGFNIRKRNRQLLQDQNKPKNTD